MQRATKLGKESDGVLANPDVSTAAIQDALRGTQTELSNEG
jgi:hypothetical protein